MPEFNSCSQESGNSVRVLRGRVWTAREGKVTLYGPASELIAEELRDVDGDGRPDIIIHGPYADTTTIWCGSEDAYPVYGPIVLAHSLADGTFAWADTQAVLFAKRSCAILPSPAIVDERERPQIVDFARSARNIACARLWGSDRGRVGRRRCFMCIPPQSDRGFGF